MNITQALFDFSYYPSIHSARLSLRRLRDDDAPSILRLYSDAEVLRFIALDVPCNTLEQASLEIKALNRVFDDRRGCVWGITLTGNDEVIGTCSWYDWSQVNRRVTIGYDLQYAYWGKGIATEAVRVLLDWCFAHLNVHRVQADCTAGNKGSERVLEKTGFTLEGVWRESSFENGQFVDVKQYGLLEREYYQTEGFPK